MDNRLDLASGSLGKIVSLRLKPGMKIFETLKQVVTEENIEYAIIINGVGANGHVVFCGVQPSGAALGRHLVEAEVYSTTEITLVEAKEMKLLREICSETKALELKPTNN